MEELKSIITRLLQEKSDLKRKNEEQSKELDILREAVSSSHAVYLDLIQEMNDRHRQENKVFIEAEVALKNGHAEQIRALIKDYEEDMLNLVKDYEDLTPQCLVNAGKLFSQIYSHFENEQQINPELHENDSASGLGIMNEFLDLTDICKGIIVASIATLWQFADGTGRKIDWNFIIWLWPRLTISVNSLQTSSQPVVVVKFLASSQFQIFLHQWGLGESLKECVTTLIEGSNISNVNLIRLSPLVFSLMKKVVMNE